MNQIPEYATRYYNCTYYAPGEGHFAVYYTNGKWVESFTVTNEQLPNLGVSCVRKLP